MGVGSFLPVRRIAIVQAIHAVPRARFYFKKLFGVPAETPAEKPALGDWARDVRVRVGEDGDDDGDPDDETSSRRSASSFVASSRGCVIFGRRPHSRVLLG